MTAQTPLILKTYFENGDFPNQQNFADLIDSSLNVVATAAQSLVSDLIVPAITVSALTITGPFTLTNVTINGKITASAASFAGNVSANTMNIAGAVSANTINLAVAVTSPVYNLTGANKLYLPAANTPVIAANGVDAARFATLVAGTDTITFTPGKVGTSPKISVDSSANNDVSIDINGKGTKGLNTIFATNSTTVAASNANLAMFNTDPTVNNMTKLSFGNGSFGTVAAIAGINENHNGSGTGHLSFVIYNAGSGAEALKINSDSTATFSSTVSAASFNATNNIVGTNLTVVSANVPSLNITTVTGPASTAWTPGYTGFSANPTAVAQYLKIGRQVTLFYTATGNGTSNATTFTITGAPFTAVGNQPPLPVLVTDAGIQTTGTAQISGTMITITKGAATGGGGFTNTGNKALAGIVLVYESTT